MASSEQSRVSGVREAVRVTKDVADNLVVKGTKGGVQDDNRGGAVETPCQADPLSLSSRHQNSPIKSSLLIIQFKKRTSFED